MGVNVTPPGHRRRLEIHGRRGALLFRAGDTASVHGPAHDG